MPEISVIIPIYNVEKYIEKCLKSVQDQSFKDIEIICIDDCSTDNSATIAEEYAKKDDRIKIIRHKTNKGLGAARNTGLRHACGKYVHFLDSDDHIDRVMLEKTRNKLEETGLDSVWMVSRSYFENDDIYVIENFFKHLIKYPEGLIEINSGNINTFPGFILNKVYSLDFIRKNGLWFPEALLYEDAEFYFKFYTRSAKVYFMRETLCTYVRRNGSITFDTELGLGRREDICRVTYNIYRDLKENGLFEKYKETLEIFILRKFKYYMKISAYRDRLTDQMQKLLREIGFPEDYKESSSEAYCFMRAVFKYDKSKKVKNFIFTKTLKFLSWLTNIIPFPKIRRKVRRNIKKYYF